MNVDEAFEHVKQQRPQVIFVNGRTATGKTTFAKRVGGDLGYTVIEMDNIMRDHVIKPLGLQDNGMPHVEVYKLRNRLDWIEMFVKELRERIKDSIYQGHSVIVDGAMPNVTTIKQWFGGLPRPEIIFFHPVNIDNYSRQITQRFETTNEDSNGSLPPSFWGKMGKSTFEEFCRTREITPEIKDIIIDYTKFSMKAADERLETMRKNFDDVLVVEI